MLFRSERLSLGRPFLLLVLQDQAKLNEWQGEDYTQASFLRFDQTLVMSMRPALAMLLASTEETSR